MAERVAQKMAQDAGLTTVHLTSAATSSEEIGNPIDPRAVHVLQTHGYRSDGHRAHQISAKEIQQADLVIGMERLHLDIMTRRLPGATNLALITDFDPSSDHDDIDDPWSGPPDGFTITLNQIEAAMPGVLDWARHHR
jgi:protein-tyrosine phosphatase